MIYAEFIEGATAKSVILRAITVSTGLPCTTLVYNTSGLTGIYWRGGMGTPPAAVGFSCVNLASGPATAHTEGGFVHIGGGLYRFDLHNAALVSGADFVGYVLAGVTDVYLEALWVDIRSNNPRAAKVGVGSIDANVITAASMASDAGTEIAAAVMAATASGSAGTMGGLIASLGTIGTNVAALPSAYAIGQRVLLALTMNDGNTLAVVGSNLVLKDNLGNVLGTKPIVRLGAPANPMQSLGI